MLHHPDGKGPSFEGDTSEFFKAQEAYEKLHEAKAREEKTKPTPKKIAETDTDADTRPFNIFNPRPRAPPRAPTSTTITPGATTKRLYTYSPNAKFHDVGSEMEEH